MATASDWQQTAKKLGRGTATEALASRNLFPLTAFKNARPEPQICPKFVPAIVLGGSSRGVQNLKKIVKICLKITAFQILTTFFFQIFDLLTGTPKKQSPGQILDKFGVRGGRF